MVELNREFLEKIYGNDKLQIISEMFINYKKIKKVDSNTFKELSNLEILFLIYNQIEEIDCKLFESLIVNSLRNFKIPQKSKQYLKKK